MCPSFHLCRPNGKKIPDCYFNHECEGASDPYVYWKESTEEEVCPVGSGGIALGSGTHVVILRGRGARWDPCSSELLPHMIHLTNNTCTGANIQVDSAQGLGVSGQGGGRAPRKGPWPWDSGAPWCRAGNPPTWSDHSSDHLTNWKI